MKVKLITLGCKANSYDSDEIMKELAAAGFTEADDTEIADVAIINTCAVTNESVRQSRQAARKAAASNPSCILVLTGCASELSREELRAQTGAHIVTGTKDRGEIARLLAGMQLVAAPAPIEVKTRRQRIDIKIQDGCNMGCSYCVIPKARGSSVSMPVSEVCARVGEAVSKGYMEATLSGICLAAYRSSGMDVASLAQEVAKRTGVKRLRIGSVEPFMLTKEFCEKLSSIEAFCPHLHLSVQSGSDRILRLMNRRYNRQSLFDGIQTAKKQIETVSLTADMIAGFPSESEEDFEQSLDMIKFGEFEHVHVFPFSARDGTLAAKMPCQKTKAEKAELVKRMIGFSGLVSKAAHEKMVGSELHILVERETGGYWEGFSEHYIRSRVTSTGDLAGSLVTARADSVWENGLNATISHQKGD
ncbi:MAG: tRNA (N(6)-L-threonylcarbamoyladenosine(37)-C(2))-methylthiotransferase MtaB [Eubacteriaceae bacterium]|nr:tRNA (N(6)-L-threonylcarbamoyladenosine(37)-C(2))-methylthiotransferase MtaB [Eubacteriaceae bacterium]